MAWMGGHEGARRVEANRDMLMLSYSSGSDDGSGAKNCCFVQPQAAKP